MIQTKWQTNVFSQPPKSKRWFTSLQKDKLKALYPTASREKILSEFPNHSWEAIMERARRMKIRRRNIKHAAN